MYSQACVSELWVAQRTHCKGNSRKAHTVKCVLFMQNQLLRPDCIQHEAAVQFRSDRCRLSSAFALTAESLRRCEQQALRSTSSAGTVLHADIVMVGSHW